MGQSLHGDCKALFGQGQDSHPPRSPSEGQPHQTLTLSLRVGDELFPKGKTGCSDTKEEAPPVSLCQAAHCILLASLLGSCPSYFCRGEKCPHVTPLPCCLLSTIFSQDVAR